jgi:hypothetical protein
MPEQRTDHDDRLPVPAGPRAALRRRTGADERVVVRRPWQAGPVLAASLLGAAAAAAVTGAAVAARLLSPWAGPALRDVVDSREKRVAPAAQWLGSGVRISYTRIEIFWPGRG